MCRRRKGVRGILWGWGRLANGVGEEPSFDCVNDKTAANEIHRPSARTAYQPEEAGETSVSYLLCLSHWDSSTVYRDATLSNLAPHALNSTGAPIVCTSGVGRCNVRAIGCLQTLNIFSPHSSMNLPLVIPHPLRSPAKALALPLPIPS